MTTLQSGITDRLNLDEIRCDREAGTPGPWILRENKHQFSLYTKEGPDHSGYGRRIADVIYWGADHTGPKENPLYSAASSYSPHSPRITLQP